MSEFDDHEDDIVYGRQWGYDHDRDEPKEVRCKFCGSTAVRWRQQTGKWVLFSLQPGIEHQCPARGAASPDEFN